MPAPRNELTDVPVSLVLLNGRAHDIGLGGEVFIATRSDPYWRHRTGASIAELVRRWNSHAALVAALEEVIGIAENVHRHSSTRCRDVVIAARAALALAEPAKETR